VREFHVCFRVELNPQKVDFSCAHKRSLVAAALRKEPRVAYIQFQPMRALKAARALIADPEDLPQVYTIVEALSGDTLARVARRMRRDAGGRRLLSARPDVVDVLADRSALARLPEGTLGRAYLEFIDRENISPEGIRAASHEGSANTGSMPQPLDWVYARIRDTHDLWHAATGYAGDVLGEVALQAFTFAQTWNPAVGLIIGAAFLKTFGAGDRGAEARRTIIDGFKRGLRAEWLLAQEWEDLLGVPLPEIRERLSLGAPPVYETVRANALDQWLRGSAAKRPS
jgi:ubiquinone biosynthesis protein COQ4